MRFSHLKDLFKVPASKRAQVFQQMETALGQAELAGLQEQFVEFEWEDDDASEVMLVVGSPAWFALMFMDTSVVQ